MAVPQGKSMWNNKNSMDIRSILTYIPRSFLTSLPTFVNLIYPPENGAASMWWWLALYK
jgi:hypothetical protein